MPKFTSSLLPSTALHQQQLSKSVIYSIHPKLLLSFLAETASVNASFGSVLSHGEEKMELPPEEEAIIQPTAEKTATKTTESLSPEGT